VYCAIFGLPVVWSFIEHPFGVNLPMSADAPLNKALHYCICVHFLSKFLDYVDTTLIIIGETCNVVIIVLYFLNHQYYTTASLVD